MNIKKLFLAVLAIVSLSVSANAQSKQMKIAHINSAELMDGLPQVDTINLKLERLQKEYQRMLDAIKTELAQKETFWEANPTDDPDILLLRQKEYEELVQRYQNNGTRSTSRYFEKASRAIYTVIRKSKKGDSRSCC